MLACDLVRRSRGVERARQLARDHRDKVLLYLSIYLSIFVYIYIYIYISDHMHRFDLFSLILHYYLTLVLSLSLIVAFYF